MATHEDENTSSMPSPLAIGTPSRARLTLQSRLAAKQRLENAQDYDDGSAIIDPSTSGLADDDAREAEAVAGPGLTRQTTREAAERRPLDDDSDEEFGEDEQESSQVQQQNHNTARQREQEKLLQQWGLSEGGRHRSPPGYDEDDDDGNDDEDDDDDDAGVEMGTKYLRNRTHRES